MNRRDGNAWINFAMYAVLGKMAEADDLMRVAGAGIRRVADELARRRPAPSVPLFRGMLLDPAEALAVCDKRMWVSWSESLDVACWFGSTDSVVSQPLAESNPRLRGVVLELPHHERLLFHYSWAFNFGEMARLHPHMGDEGARQIAWSLRTQREVITEPLDSYPLPVPVEDRRARSVRDLDSMLALPWVDAVLPPQPKE